MSYSAENKEDNDMITQKNQCNQQFQDKKNLGRI